MLDLAKVVNRATDWSAAVPGLGGQPVKKPRSSVHWTSSGRGAPANREEGSVAPGLRGENRERLLKARDLLLPALHALLVPRLELRNPDAVKAPKQLLSM